MSADRQNTASKANSKFSQWEKSRQTGNTAQNELSTLGILFVIGLLGEVDYQMISPLLPLIARDFSIPSAEASRVVPVYALASAVFSLIFGYLSDLWGRKPFMVAGLLCFSAAAMLARFSATLETFFIARFLTGTATGAIVTSATSYAADYFSYERRGRAMGMLSTAYFAAAIVGVPLATIVAAKSGWRSLFLWSSGMALLCGLLVGSSIIERTGEASEKSAAAGRFSLTRLRRVSGEILRRGETLAILVASMLSSGAIVGFITFLGSHLNLNLRVSVQQVGLAFLISGAASLLGAPLSGVIADKWGKRPLLILSGLVLASALAVIPGMAWGPELFGMMGLAGFAMAFRIAPLLALTTELVEPEVRGTFLALRSALASLGIAVSTLVSSYCYQIGGYQAVGLFASGLILASTVLILVLVREPYHRR